MMAAWFVATSADLLGLAQIIEILVTPRRREDHGYADDDHGADEDDGSDRRWKMATTIRSVFENRCFHLKPKHRPTETTVPYNRPMSRRTNLDVVVVGAGTAGAAAALHLAGECGRRVALIESRKLDEAGARWVDDVPPWMFDRAKIARPEPPEKRCDELPLRLIGVSQRGRVGLTRPMWGIETPSLVARLQAAAIERGVVAYDQTVLDHLEFDGDRPRQLVATAAGTTTADIRLEAKLFIDATGQEQALLRRVPALNRWCPQPRGEELVSAVQFVCDVLDADRARDFLRRRRTKPGEVTTCTGIRGGFSSRMVTVSPSFDEVEVLAGVVADGAHGTGAELIDELRQRNPWIGPVRLGGGGLIPVRRPYDRLAAPGIALVGDAACQTFPAHGSGIGSGLIAARILAEHVGQRSDPGSLESTWAYSAAFHRERGGVHAAYDVFRRAIQSLRGEELERLLLAGLIGAGSARRALDQRMPHPTFNELASLLRGVVAEPRLASRFGPTFAQMGLVAAAYRRYPRRPSWKELVRWSRLSGGLAGFRPDVQNTRHRSVAPAPLDPLE